MKMKRITLSILIISLCLPACLPMARKPHLRETYQVLVTIHYCNPQEIRREYANSLRANGSPVDAYKLGKVKGFAEWNESNRKGPSDLRVGTIYVPKPPDDRTDAKAERIIGHEIRHIIEGYFHK